MDMCFTKLVRRAALPLLLGFSLQAQSAQIVSLELSLSSSDISTLVNRIPMVAAPSVASGHSAVGLSASAEPLVKWRVTKADAAFASAASTNGWLKGPAAPVLMLAGLLVLGLVRQQRVNRHHSAVSL